ncbi:MAG: hypothetical protein H0V06_00865 [Gemmatimonadetes bacterium]|nr:hypothetical protein [Gemmatimonadota bacterium]
MNWTDEVLRALAVGGAFLVVFAAAELWKHWGNPPVEWTRKAVHVGGGVIVMTLPWILRSHWTVLALGAAFALIIALTRRFGWLGSVHGVERKSEGGLWYPVAVYLLFLIGSHRPVFYLIAVLTLVLSDALAALVGTTYGRMMYRVESDRRSVEGSAVFLFATFLGVHLPLLLLTSTGRVASVLIALQIALLVTLLEAISLRGNDNLVVPLATYLLLVKLTPSSAEWIAVQLASQLAIFGALILLAWRSRFLSASGTMAASLFFYGAWSLGGPEWTVAPAVALAAFWLIFKRLPPNSSEPDARYQVVAVFYTSLVPVSLFALNNLFETVLRHPVLGRGDPFYALYLGALTAHLAMLALLFLEGSLWDSQPKPKRWVLALGIGVAAAIPIGLWAGPSGVSWWEVVMPVWVGVGALAFFSAGRRWARWPHQKPWDVRLQMACAALSVGTLLPVHLLRFMGQW